ncbi:MAG: hypothetical protein US96_C0014G0017 [Candidatus Woesebacteria bacterium GW2011_GWB1_38_5b]|uniref:SCP domain-containing protein n=1 Tax=Candidatus Woesebacteria bacterium GW2011_GWB1_38_5b TaxID=1618569 RepID=A0A0G0MNL8_9BACT|nr:MAG: hypothetical protein US96_C0014G0017 [Candidatus Woesebacteria bacterium GW2011_GWB1_38_5b]
MQGNWVDLIIIVILIYFASEAWRIGLWVILADFFSFLLSLLFSLRIYQSVSELLRTNFNLSHSVSNALGFLLTAVLTEVILGYLFARALSRLPHKYKNKPFLRFLAIFPAFGEGLVIIAFVLMLVLALPLSPRVKTDAAKSKIGSVIISQTSGLEKSLSEIFGGVIEDSLTYFTVKPESRETVPLHTDKHELTVDQISETQMFELVNQERKKAGVGQLVWAPQIVPIARAHAKDMWERQYFGHVSPDGKDVGDRLQKAKIDYQLAGENLAMAPTLATANTGLMNSQGHRENILEPKFKKIGIGVIENGYYGKMFVQVFTD